jgi:hypothetical protein
MNSAQITELISDISPEALLADGFDDALVGYTSGSLKQPPVAIYDRQKCIEILMVRDHMSMEDAEDYFTFNKEGAYVADKNGPIFAEFPQLRH